MDVDFFLIYVFYFIFSPDTSFVLHFSAFFYF